MAYPTLAIHKDSKRIVRDGRAEDLSVSGVARVRNFQSADKYDFELHHPSLTSSDVTTLKNHYDANRTASFDFTWPEDGVTYTGLRYGKGGLRTQWVSPTRRDAWVRLVGS